MSNERNNNSNSSLSKKDVKAPKQSKTLQQARNGRDEMNLAEFPFASLWRGDTKGAVIELEWEQSHPVTQKTVKALWRVAGDPEMGLPTISDERLYVVLMALTKERGMKQAVQFSRYDLLQRLGWSDNAKHYTMLKDGFTRLKAVSIRAENCFWSPQAKDYVSTAGFNVIDDYEIVAERRGRKSDTAALPLSWFQWSDRIFQSMVDGYVKGLDVQFALSLDRPLSLRLFRYLDKKRHGTPKKFQIGMRKLCEFHLGMDLKDNAYPSVLRQRLEPAHDELRARGFLTNVAYMPMGTQDGEKVIYSFGEKPKEAKPKENKKSPQAAPEVFSENSRRERAKAIYDALEPEKRRELLGRARDGVIPIFWDRVEDINSPFSVRLWDLVLSENE